MGLRGAERGNTQINPIKKDSSFYVTAQHRRKPEYKSVASRTAPEQSNNCFGQQRKFESRRHKDDGLVQRIRPGLASHTTLASRGFQPSSKVSRKPLGQICWSALKTLARLGCGRRASVLQVANGSGPSLAKPIRPRRSNGSNPSRPGGLWGLLDSPMPALGSH
jgi:hypothetical protein